VPTDTAFCGTIQCEVISSNITSQTGELAPSGSVSLRVRPGDVDKLIAYVGKQGKVAQHATETQDKTTNVVDTDARIKNLTEFRDNLRKMLARPAVSVKDLVEIQEKLEEVQAELDGETARRKDLANETEKVAVEIEFRAERTTASVSAFKPIGDALRESASVLSESLASLITAVVAVIPWLIVIVPGGWFLVKVWRRARRKRAGAEPAA
jgi:DNA repair ATPase RecN